MASFRASFEKELKQRLTQKSTSHSSDEAVLLKSFKYFDLDNSGNVDQSEFIKVVEKIGIPIFNKQDFIDLFNYYDVNGDGRLDYKEFSAMIFGYSTAVTRKDSPKKPSSMKRANDYFQGHTQQDAVTRFQEKLRSRGATGILGIARQFKIFDDDNSRTLDIQEFTKAVRDFRVDLTEQEIQDVFDYFDRNRDNVINYDEFLLGIRGPMSQNRRRLVQQAFAILDKDGSGIVDINDIKGTYNAKFHPDVRSGKRTEESVLLEFMSTFETYVGFRGIRDNQITPQEFEDYYTFISASIDRDDYFELMMNNAWRMNDGANKNWNTKGWASNTQQNANLQSAYRQKFDQPSNQHTPYSIRQQEQQQTPQKSVRSGVQSQQQTPPQQSYQRNNQEQEERVKRSGNQQQPLFSQQNYNNQRPQQSVTFDVKDLMTKVRNKLKTRGTSGLLGIQRQFRIMDDNFDKCISYPEFRKAMNDYKMNLSDEEMQALFQYIDMNGNGVIEIDELVRNLQGEMNDFRRGLVDQAFNKLDKNRDGTLTVNDIKGVYSAKNHPDVRSGKKTEDEILGEFLETFELHHHLKVGMKDQRVSREEFHEYYNNVSANIDNDQYFELMIVNAYRLYQDNPSQYQQYAPANYKNQEYRVGGPQEFRSKTTQNAPFGTSNAPTDYSTNLRPKTGNTSNLNLQKSAVQSQPAGNPSWPGYNWRPQSSHGQSNPVVEEQDERVKRAGRNVQPQGQQQQSETQSVQQSQYSQYSQQQNYSQLNSEELFQTFRKKLTSRGTRGILSLGRLYRIIDDDGNRSISFNEFSKVCKDLRVGLNEQQVAQLFKLFDRDGSGSIDYDEFVRAVRGSMNKFRLDLVLAVFAKLDRNRNGVIEVDDILGVYDASKHPDVRSRKKTEEEVLGDFLDTFEQHHAIQTANNKGRDKSVTVDEFVEYYNNVSASIDDDQYFEHMIRSGWKI
ncbi:hypothetical protein ABPG74_004193 [Tetrahymena malaccensis]